VPVPLLPEPWFFLLAGIVVGSLPLSYFDLKKGPG
jgi:hypothetical protein